MPAQSFRRFSRSERRPWVNRRFDSLTALARLAVFGGSVALTAYGAYQMYRVVGLGTTTTLEWVMLVLFVVTFLLGRVLLHRQSRRLRLAARAFAQAWPASGRAVGKDCGCDADLQRGAVAGVRRDAGDHRRRRADRTGLFIRLFLPFRYDRRQCLDRRGAGLRRDAPTLAERTRLLSAEAQEFEPQGRQHRRLRHPLGRPLPAHAGARR